MDFKTLQEYNDIRGVYEQARIEFEAAERKLNTADRAVRKVGERIGHQLGLPIKKEME